jgi:hypothetical protein
LYDSQDEWQLKEMTEGEKNHTAESKQLGQSWKLYMQLIELIVKFP